MNNQSPIEKIPFLKIIPCVVAGIFLGEMVDVSIWVTVVCLVLMVLCSFVWRKLPVGGVYVAASLMLFATLSTQLRTTREIIPYGEWMKMTLVVVDNPVEVNRWQRCGAVVDSYRAADDTLWSRGNQKIILNVDTSYKVSVGERLIVEAYFNPLIEPDDTVYVGYANLMRRRGYGGSCYVTKSENVITLPKHQKGLRYYAYKLQKGALERFDRLEVEGDNGLVCKAMTFGWRGGLDRELKESYSHSGAAHLLAVSGLHVGIVAILINFLLALFPLFGRNGHIIRNVVAVLSIWLYAFLTGLSPSVVRAAFMFTGVQIAFATSNPNNAVNTLLGTATVMLLFNPNYLYDISFQLSFLAVLGIFVGFPYMMRLVRSRSMLLNAVWGLFIVGFCAVLVTAPITSYQFGKLPLLGVFINPVVIVTANIIVLLSLLWCLMPFEFMRPIVGTVLDWVAGVQNDVVGWLGAQEWAAVSVRIPLWGVFTIYGVALIIWLIVSVVKRDKKGLKLMK